MRDPRDFIGVIQGRATTLYLRGETEELKRLASTLTKEQAAAVRSHLKTVKQVRLHSRQAGKTKRGTTVADPVDIAGEREQQDRDNATANHLNRRQEAPDQDESGNRFCLDCGDQINPQRVASINAVRCVDCAGLREKQTR